MLCSASRERNEPRKSRARCRSELHTGSGNQLTLSARPAPGLSTQDTGWHGAQAHGYALDMSVHPGDARGPLLSIYDLPVTGCVAAASRPGADCY